MENTKSTEQKYQIKLALENDYVLFESGTKELCENMMKWYDKHKQFFNGTFSIEEVDF